MYMANNQVVIEDLYDDNTQPPEEDIIEYAEYIGINTKEEPELMWIAKQGVKAPLPRGWKAIHDLEQNELYYFNFDTGESIWDHPCDNDFKELVIEQRKILSEKGRENYKPPANFDMTQRQSSPTRQLKSGGETLKSTSSTTSGLIGGNNNQSDRLRNTSTHSILQRPELALYDTREIDFDEVNRINFNHDDEAEQQQQQQQVNHRQEDDDSASWNNKNDDEESSEDSGGFQKPVDFGIDKETSAKLSKLDVKMMVGGEPTKENNNAESAPTTSREHLDSPTRNHIKNVLGNKYDKDENNLEIDLRKSLTDDKSYDLNTSTANNPKDFQNNLVLFQQSLEREFDQKRLELLEEKDNRIKRLKEDIDREMSRLQENERKRLLKDHEDKLNEIKRRNERELEYESEQLRRIHTEKLNQINAEFDREKQSRKEKFMTQIAKYISSGNKSGEEDMEESEEKEIGMYFDFIEKKYGQKLDDRKREIQLRYEKKLKDLDDELKQLFEKESDKKENEIRLMKEKNMLIENYDNELEKLMNERLKDFKEKEADQMNRIKEDYEIKVKAYREKYKQLEENEFNYLENEYNKIKDKMHDDYNTKITNLEMKLKSKQGLIDKQEDNLRKRMDIIQERRRNFDAEWTKLNEEERKLSEKRESLMEKSAQAVAADHYHSSKGEDDALKYKYEIEKLKLEKADLEGRLASMQRLIEKINDNLNSESRLASKELNRLDHSLEDSSVADSDKFMAKVNSVNSKLGRDFMEDEEEDSPPLPAPPVGGGDGSRRVYEDIAEEEEEEEEEEGEGGNAADKTDVIDDEEIGTAAAAQANENRGEPNEEDEDDELEEEEDDEDIKELVKQAKLKLRLKYYEARKRAQIEVAASTTPTNNVSAASAAAVVAAAQPLSHLSSISSESTDEDENENVIINNSGYQHHHHHHYQPPLPLSQEVNDTKRVLMDDLSREKDALHEANILLEKYKHSLIKRKLKLECDQDELRNDELAVTKINNSSALASKQTTSEKLKQQYLLEERKLMLEKEALELEQLGLNIKTAKRLMKQKKVQLKLLENGIKDPNNIMLSNKKSSSNNAIELVNKQEAPSNDEENNDENDYSDQLDQDTITNSRADSNLETSSQRQAAQTTPKGPITGLSNSFSSLIYRLKFNNNENTTSSPNINLTAMTGSTNGMEKLTPILKKLPKLNHRLHITFENMKSTPTQLADSAAAQHSSSSSSSLQPTVLETSSLKREIQLIDEKWRKYLESTSSAANQQHFLSNDLASKISFFQNIGTQKIELDRGGGSSPTPGGGGGAAAAATTTTTNASTKSGAGASESSRFYTAKIINGAWEKSPAYQKLTYEAGQKLLDQKWNQYIGYLSQSAAATSSSASTINNVRLSKTLNALASATAAAKKPSVVLQSQSATQHHTPPPSSSSSLSLSNGAAGFVTAYATSITLPAATQTRLNQHREWIRKFKADVDLNNNTLNNKI